MTASGTGPTSSNCSIHIDPSIGPPYYAGYAEEIWEGEGRGFTFNQPLPLATGDKAWLEAIDRALVRVREFAPGALVLSAGFDASEHDPIGAAFRITNDAFAEAGRRIAGTNIPTLLVQEGGYMNPYLGRLLQTFLRAFEARAGSSS